jgi:cobaltochelatase CobS
MFDSSFELAQFPAESQSRIDFPSWIKPSEPRPAPRSAPEPVKPSKPKTPHKRLDETVRKLRAGLNIMLVGPAGSGKTTLAEQAAGVMGLRFGFLSCSGGMSEGQITGRLLPVGAGGKFIYVTTEFVEVYENGGVFLLDEIDAADPNVLIVVNAAIAGVKLSLPNRSEKPYAVKHQDCYVISAANTYGSGADVIYVGRNQLDGATLSRFACGVIPIDYDRELEAKLVPDIQLCKLIWRLRDLCLERKFRRIVGTRELMAASKMRDAGFSVDQIFESLVVSWSADEQKAAR